MSATPLASTAAADRRSALLLATSPPGAAAGSSARVALVLEALREQFARVDVVSLSTRGDDQRVAPDVRLVSWSGPRSRWGYAASLAMGGSTFVGVRASKLSQRLGGLTRDGELLPAYDLVWSHFLITAPAGVSVPAAKRVLDADLALGAVAHRAAQKPGLGWAERTYLRLDAAAIARRERHLCARFDQIVVASELERERLGDVERPVAVVPNAVDDQRVVPTPAEARAGLLFVGSLDYEVNVEAVAFLVQRVFPQVRARLPGAELTIVGRNPSDELIRLTRAPGVTLIADAPTLEPHYAKARVVLAPLLSGGGTRIKVLEAMARALPIVATPTGIEGLSIRHGDGALVAPDASGLAEHCLVLLQDDDLADRLGQSAHAVWSQNHRPSAARGAILSVLDSLSADRARAQ
jgi:glycosyltransferase involved in cell wall biosynthesis